MTSPKLSPASPQTELASEAERIIDSATFAQSPRLREFLGFVVRCSVENREHEVNEYSIGVQVFGKSAGYNPSQDNVVRVTARHLRAKLAEYYDHDGCGSVWRLEIPKGSYLPVLLHRMPRVEPSSAPPPAPRGASRPVLWLLAGLALSGWGMALWDHSRWPAGTPPQPGYLLSPLVTDASRRTTIVLDDPMLPKAWAAIGRVMPLEEFVAGRYLNPGIYDKPFAADAGTLFGDNYYVHFSSVQTANRIADIARTHGVDAVIEHCRTLQADKMENANLVFIGGVGSDPWVSEIQRYLAFEHRLDPKDGRRIFVNRKPRPGEPELFESLRERNENVRYYTRVALLKNPFGSGRIVLLGGTSRNATEAAGQYALSETGEKEILQTCGAPPSRLSGFELILETKSLAGTPVSRKIVASRCGTRL